MTFRCFALLSTAAIACVLSPSAFAPAEAPSTQPMTSPTTHPTGHAMPHPMGMRPRPFGGRDGYFGPHEFGDEMMPPPPPHELDERHAEKDARDDRRGKDRRSEAGRGDGLRGEDRHGEERHGEAARGDDLREDVSELTSQVRKLRREIADLQDTVEDLRASQQHETRRHQYEDDRGSKRRHADRD